MLPKTLRRLKHAPKKPIKLYGFGQFRENVLFFFLPYALLYIILNCSQVLSEPIIIIKKQKCSKSSETPSKVVFRHFRKMHTYFANSCIIYFIFWYLFSDVPWINTYHLQKELGFSFIALVFHPGSVYTKPEIELELWHYPCY